MNYLCAKFDNFSFSRLARFDFIVGQTDRQTESHTHTHTHTQTRVIVILTRLPSA